MYTTQKKELLITIDGYKKIVDSLIRDFITGMIELNTLETEIEKGMEKEREKWANGFRCFDEYIYIYKQIKKYQYSETLKAISLIYR